MTLGDWIMWLTFAAGAYALIRLAMRHFRLTLRDLFLPMAGDHSVTSNDGSADSSELCRNPQSHAVDRPQNYSEPPRNHAPVLTLEPVTHADLALHNDPEWIRVTREELIESLALVIVIDADGSERKMSQEWISKGAAMSKETTAHLIRHARHESEPESKTDGPQFIKAHDNRQHYDRTGVKPLR